MLKLFQRNLYYVLYIEGLYRRSVPKVLSARGAQKESIFMTYKCFEALLSHNVFKI